MWEGFGGTAPHVLKPPAPRYSEHGTSEAQAGFTAAQKKKNTPDFPVRVENVFVKVFWESISHRGLLGAVLCISRLSSFRFRALHLLSATPKPTHPESAHRPQWPTTSSAHYVLSFQKLRLSLEPPRSSNSYATNPPAVNQTSSNPGSGPSRARRSR